MLNWLPAFILLLAHSASGSTGTVHPQTMLRALNIVVCWEEPGSTSRQTAFVAEEVSSADEDEATWEFRTEFEIATTGERGARWGFGRTLRARDGPLA